MYVLKLIKALSIRELQPSLYNTLTSLVTSYGS